MKFKFELEVEFNVEDYEIDYLRETICEIVGENDFSKAKITSEIGDIIN